MRAGRGGGGGSEVIDLLTPKNNDLGRRLDFQSVLEKERERGGVVVVVGGGFELVERLLIFNTQE